MFCQNGWMGLCGGLMVALIDGGVVVPVTQKDNCLGMERRRMLWIARLGVIGLFFVLHVVLPCLHV